MEMLYIYIFVYTHPDCFPFGSSVAVISVCLYECLSQNLKIYILSTFINNLRWKIDT